MTIETRPNVHSPWATEHPHGPFPFEPHLPEREDYDQIEEELVPMDGLGWLLLGCIGLIAVAVAGWLIYSAWAA